MALDPKWQAIKDIAQNDINSLIESEKSYGDSWKRRGGAGAFMMLARKFDRIEQQSKDCNYDVGDLRRYLLLVESEIRANNTDIRRLEHWESEEE